MRALRLMTDAAHQHGALAGLELHHGGAHAPNNVTRLPALGPSQLASDLEPRVVCKAMELDDIRRVRDDWVAAASARATAGSTSCTCTARTRTCRCSSSRPSTTSGPTRTAAAREPRTVLARAARGRAGGGRRRLRGRHADRGRGARLGRHPRRRGARVRRARRPAGRPVGRERRLDRVLEQGLGTSRYYEEGYQLEWTGRVREATAKPIVGVARLTNPDTMASIVRSGVWDLIGAARPSIADPFLPNKIAEGRLDEIRECTGSNVCIMKVDGHGHLGCIQNATAGEEHRRGWHPERFERAANADRAVLVVGAGPAGMEAAITLGKRGFEAVHLVEAEPEIGGRLRWVRRLPTLGDWGRIVDYRQIQLDKLPNVAVVTKRRLDAAAVRDYGAQIVIVATGSRWSGEGLQAVHARADRRRRRVAPPRADARTGRGRGQAAAGRARRRLRRRGVLVRPGHRRAAGARGIRDPPGDPVRRRLPHLGPHARGRTAPAAPARGRRHRAPRRDDRARRRRRHRGRGRVRRTVLARRGRRRARHAAGLGRSALPRAGRRPGGARGRGHRGRLPDRRLRRAADDLRGDLRRTPPGPRDRLPRPGPALPFDRERGVPDVAPVVPR